MNLYFKYWPLLYTYNSRIKSLWDVLWYLYTNLWLGFLTLVYLYISSYLNFWTLLDYVLLYWIIFITFNILYEIWYICNDIFSTKKEKNPTLYITDKIQNKFRHNQIVIRIIFGVWCLIWIYLVNATICFSLCCVLIWVGGIYTIHNKVRNWNINVYTFSLLRFGKFALILLLLYSLNLDIEIYKEIIAPIIIVFLMYQLYEWIVYYDRKIGGKTNIKYRMVYLYILLTQIILWFVSYDGIYIITSMYTLFPIFLFFRKCKWSLKWKSADNF